MFNLLILLTLCLLVFYWWHSGDFKALAMGFASRHCDQFNLQLLDQSMVIKGIWVEKNANSFLSVRRSYQFEFSSTGEQRYLGLLTIVGLKLKSIDTETYQLPHSN
ncbi:MAG: hypothetical protein ACJAZT_000860 [Gammaproteobacteria bacterium]|jgi:hypothetical protein